MRKVVLVVCLVTGCGGTQNTPPCGPGTFEFRGICLSEKTEPPCGPGTHEFHGVCVSDAENHCGAGTHWDPEVCEKNGRCGMCVADETPPAKTLVCGPGTLEIAGKCIPDEIPSAQFISAYVKVATYDPSVIVASYELTAPARVYYKFRYNESDAWLTWAFTQGKYKDASCPFGPLAPNTKVDWRMEARNDDDKITDTREGIVTTPPPPSTITIRASKNTPSSQTLEMGSVGVELLRFELEFDSQEEVIIDTITIKDEMSSLQNGALKNFKLMNGAVEYAGVSALSITSNATFGGMGLKWIGNGKYAVTLSIKADITAAEDGGMPSSHRLRVTGATATTKSGVPVKVTISTGSNEPAGNWMMIIAANLDKNTEFSLASNSPAGPTWPGQDQVWHIARVTAKNFTSQLSQLVYKFECGGCYNPLKPMRQLYTSPTAVGPWKLASTANAVLVTGGTTTFNTQLTVPAGGELYLAFVGDSTPLSAGGYSLTVVLQSATVSLQYINPPGTSGPHGALGLPVTGNTLTF